MIQSDRIEVYERYVANEDEIEYLEEIGVPADKRKDYRYRRTNPRVDDIERVIEIEGNPFECILKFYGGYSIVIKENFDAFCIMLNDLWNSNIVDE